MPVYCAENVIRERCAEKDEAARTARGEIRKMEVKCDALMLRATDYKDNDKLLTLFAAGRGKLIAVCRGVRKAAAKLKFAAQPFCFAEYVLVERAGRFTVTSASLHDGFYSLREDIGRFYAASAVIELCNQLLPEGMESDALFLSAVRTLERMAEGEERSPLLSFLLDAAAVAGYTLRINGCLQCGGEIRGRGLFSFEQGGFYCGECPAENCVPASESTFFALRAAAQGEEISDADGFKRALRLMKEYFLRKTGCRIESLSEYIRLI